MLKFLLALSIGLLQVKPTQAGQLQQNSTQSFSQWC
jgi:hypothetical protein